ncbi:MAG: PAS domain-containing protein, partial [Chloroflexales bacterium]|nr:PAS domain-containing protein [Chloroflexales bacterium]
APDWHVFHEDGTAVSAADHPLWVALRSGEAAPEAVLGLAAPHLSGERWLRIQAVPQVSPGATTGTQVYTIFEDITAQRQAHHALEEERQRLDAIVQTLYEAVIAFHPDGTLALVNTAALQLAGVADGRAPTTLMALVEWTEPRAGDAQGRPLPPEAWPQHRVLRGESFANLELCLRPQAEEPERWFAVSGTPVYDAQGDLLLGVITAQEITRRKRGEVALRAATVQAETYARAAAEHAARLDSLLAHAPVGISLLDTELRFQQINAYLAAINGLPREAHLGRTLGEVLPALAPELEARYGQVLATGEPLLDVEVRGETPAAPGVPRVWRASYFPVRAATGPLLGVGVVLIEMTAQWQAEQARQAAYQQIETILQTLDEGVVAVEPGGTFVLINPAACRQMRLNPAALPHTLAELDASVAMTLYDPAGALIPTQDHPVRRALRGERFQNLEVRMRVAGAPEDRWMVFSGAPVYAADGALALAVVTGDDITQRKRDAMALAAHAEILSKTNAELNRALRLKDEFLAMMSHELRTPLNVILGFTEGMEAGLFGSPSERQREALGKVLHSGRHLLAILSDILDLAHLEAGNTVLDPQPIEVDLLCRSALQFVQAAAQQKRIRLLCTVEEGVVGLRADERRLTQILVNLLDNAVKFTPGGESVGLQVAADAAQERIQFTVWDTGIGIAAADLDRLFQPFTQVDGRLSRQYGGIGLGLSLVRRLVDLHGGSISLESTPGQGSRFIVSLPWANGDNVAPVGDRAPAAPPPAWARAPRVVIADDHELTLAFYRDLLSEQGCQVTVARTGTEAVTLVRETRPDVAVLDIQMPELDGLMVIRQLRADPAFAGLPIIALTALAMPGDRERALAAGATRYLAKPVSLRALVATMAEVLTGTDADSPRV